MKNYIVSYRLYEADKERSMMVIAKSKEDAYDIATFQMIPEIENDQAYSSWVTGYVRKDGTIHYFKTWEGNAY